jgi:hypothetical protein
MAQAQQKYPEFIEFAVRRLNIPTKLLGHRILGESYKKVFNDAQNNRMYEIESAPASFVTLSVTLYEPLLP